MQNKNSQSYIIQYTNVEGTLWTDFEFKSTKQAEVKLISFFFYCFG